MLLGNITEKTIVYTINWRRGFKNVQKNPNTDPL